MHVWCSTKCLTHSCCRFWTRELSYRALGHVCCTLYSGMILRSKYLGFDLCIGVRMGSRCEAVLVWQ
ncbi:hypothetical protein M6B38_190140 [Iris pallida]|uniref:Uncharacterized protein n=1 Tax=Iris pallida TaxID=29817 RepID=A0AAX6EG35_IRIPA|nr:hypothetical protein M6B38_190140 [Iris pallida]